MVARWLSHVNLPNLDSCRRALRQYPCRCNGLINSLRTIKCHNNVVLLAVVAATGFVASLVLFAFDSRRAEQPAD